MRARCIDRPQFGQAGPAVIGLPAGRNEFCIANMVYLTGALSGAFSNAWLKFKRLFETRSRRK